MQNVFGYPVSPLKSDVSSVAKCPLRNQNGKNRKIPTSICLLRSPMMILIVFYNSILVLAYLEALDKLC